MRDTLLDCFQKTLQMIHGEHCVQQALAQHPISEKQCNVVAIGKAAQAMAQGAEKVLAKNLMNGLLITKHQHSDSGALSSCWQCHEASHPVPDETSLAAGRYLLEFIETHDDLPILFLISGGASSLVEVLPAHISLAQWQALNNWLLPSGLDISSINSVRKTVSGIKGGKLLGYLHDRDIHALMISDVPGDQVHVIGSGLLFNVAHEQTLNSNIKMPDWINDLIDNPDRSGINTVQGQLASQQIIASNRLAMQSAADIMRQAGYPVYWHDEFFGGDTGQTAAELANYLQNDAEPGFHIWGGETTMILPQKPGRGGRNQHLALAAAYALAGNEQVTLLAAGTDGTDGPTEDAGAIVDGGTIARGQLAGLEVEEHLTHADSGRFLEASGDLLYTGPTGTNVMDLVMAIKTAKTA
ncbi:MAG: DUF4147 domain-containing protein [Thioalkalispiraceae bacterium]